MKAGADLVGDGGFGGGLILDVQALLGLNGLMQAIPPPPSHQRPPSEFINNHDLQVEFRAHHQM